MSKLLCGCCEDTMIEIDWPALDEGWAEQYEQDYVKEMI